MKTFELTPTNGRKSFNRKAVVNESEGVYTLISYGTHVATYDKRRNNMYVFGYFSPTTAIHINTFLEYYGFEKMSKQELINLEK